jgi:hypothetical protein
MWEEYPIGMKVLPGQRAQGISPMIHKGRNKQRQRRQDCMLVGNIIR